MSGFTGTIITTCCRQRNTLRALSYGQTCICCSGFRWSRSLRRGSGRTRFRRGLSRYMV